MSCPRPNTPRSDPKNLGELSEPLRSRVWTAMLDAPRFAGGGPSGLTTVSGLRDAGRQWDLRHARCPGQECDRSCKGYPVTAVPYASKHQTGEAVDLGGVDLDWLIENRSRYGLGLTVRSEDWHFEASGTDARTGKPIPSPSVPVVPFPVGLAPLANPPQGYVTPSTGEDFLSHLTADEQREILRILRNIDRELTVSVPDALDPKGHSTKAGTLRWRLTTLLNRTADLVSGRRPGT